MHQIKFIDLGLKSYKETWDYQEELLEQVKADKKNLSEPRLEGYVLFVEHPHVYTIGKSGQDQNLLISGDFLKQIGASVYHINRGGDITYHGPGQLVCYPVINLEQFQLGVREYIYKLEEAVILALKMMNIHSGRLEGATGIWLDPQSTAVRKICAIGVRVSRFITMHGFALNVNTNLDYFDYIHPCGYTDKGVTSIAKELGKNADFENVKQLVKENLGEVFDINFR
jgi:lipoyl(octanoyl) transferase